MYCHIISQELTIETCPVSCMYKAPDETCGYERLKDSGPISFDLLAEFKGISIVEAKERVSRGTHWLIVALAFDRYLDYLFPTRNAVNYDVEKRWVMRIFSIKDEQLRKAMSEVTYTAWAAERKVDVPYRRVVSFVANIRS